MGGEKSPEMYFVNKYISLFPVERSGGSRIEIKF